MRQRTIAEKISCTGIGLHSGEPVQLTLAPARAGSGVVFVRTDLSHPVEIPAHPQSVASTRYATTLGRGETRPSKVERHPGNLAPHHKSHSDNHAPSPHADSL